MKIDLKFRTIAVSCFGALLMGWFVTAIAADKLDIGKDEYDGACAVCHGLTGKGNGPMMAQFVTHIPDLTTLAKNNNGVFPFDRVYQIIDGRSEVQAHGSRDMPIWGRHFKLQTSIYFENYPNQDDESSVRSRILALTEYLYRLQAE